MSSATKAGAQQDASASSPRQLMCSPNRAEVEAVREELNKAGIIAETRNNPTAEALGVTGIELWVKDERDFSDAASLYAKLQARPRGCPPNAPAEPKGKADALRGATDGLQGAMVQSRLPGLDDACSPPASTPHADKLEEDTSFLEKQIEEMLEFQKEVVSQCVSVRSKTRHLRRALTDRQAALSLENETQAKAQEKQAEEISSLQSALQRERSDRQQAELQLDSERAKREKAEEQLGRERQEWQQQSKSHEDSLKKAQENLEVQARLIQTHTAAVLRLKREIAALEAQRDEEQKSLAKLREDVSKERKARVAAEQRAETSTPARGSLRLPSLFFRRLAGKKADSN